MRAIAFDFDGVLCDSSRELFVSAVDTYLALEPDSRLVSRLSPLRDQAWAGGEGFREDPAARQFTDLLPLGNRAEDFGVALCSIDDGTVISGQAEYDSYFRSVEAAWRDGFHRAFYQTRERIRSRDLEKWLGLHRPYPGLAEALERKGGTFRAAVATAKDAASISLLLSELGLEGVFDSSMVFDKETGVEKTNHLRALQNRLGIPYSDITFIDDKVNHLITVSRLGVRPVLAGWGFNSDRELELARESGFEVARLDDLDKTLFKGA